MLFVSAPEIFADISPPARLNARSIYPIGDNIDKIADENAEIAARHVASNLVFLISPSGRRAKRAIAAASFASPTYEMSAITTLHQTFTTRNGLLVNVKHFQCEPRSSRMRGERVTGRPFMQYRATTLYY